MSNTIAFGGRNNSSGRNFFCGGSLAGPPSGLPRFDFRRASPAPPNSCFLRAALKFCARGALPPRRLEGRRLLPGEQPLPAWVAVGVGGLPLQGEGGGLARNAPRRGAGEPRRRVRPAAAAARRGPPAGAWPGLPGLGLALADEEGVLGEIHVLAPQPRVEPSRRLARSRSARSSCITMARTCCRVRSTGHRSGFLVRAMSSSHSRGRSRPALSRNGRELSAWFWVEAASFPSPARCVGKAWTVDLRPSPLLRVPLAGEHEKAPRPADLSVPGPDAVVKAPKRGPHRVGPLGEDDGPGRAHIIPKKNLCKSGTNPIG